MGGSTVPACGLTRWAARRGAGMNGAIGDAWRRESEKLARGPDTAAVRLPDGRAGETTFLRDGEIPLPGSGSDTAARRRRQTLGGCRSWFRGSVQSRRPAGSGTWRAGEREHRMPRDNGPYVPEIGHRSEFSGSAGDAGVGHPPRPPAAGFDSHRRSWQRGVPAAPISTKDLYRAGTRSWRETRLQRLRHSLLRPQQVTAQVPEMRKRGPNHAAEDGGGRAKDRRCQ